jgi:hypothetical protein
VIDRATAGATALGGLRLASLPGEQVRDRDDGAGAECRS